MKQIGEMLKTKKASPSARREDPFFSLKFKKRKFENGFVQTPYVMINDPALSCQDLRVLQVIESFAQLKDLCCPGYEKIAKRSKLCKEMVRRSLKNLRKYNYIYWRRTSSSNIYLMLWKNQDPTERLSYFKKAQIGELKYLSKRKYK